MFRSLFNRTQPVLSAAIRSTTWISRPTYFSVYSSLSSVSRTHEPNVSVSPDLTSLQVRWNAAAPAHDDLFPLTWLRTHCQCPKCFHPDTKSRRILAKELRLDPKVDRCLVDGEKVVVNWDDGHESVYDSTWLRERSFQHPIADVAHPKRQLWGADFVPKTFDFASTVSSDSVMLSFLHEYKIHGLVILVDAPTDALECLGKVVFDFPHKTHYGEYFEVKNKPLPSNLAYTSAELGLHNDLPFLHNIPDIQALHCLLQTTDIEGGANIFVDVALVANRLRTENPQAFDLLTKEKATFWDIGTDAYGHFHMRNSRPVLSMNPETMELEEVAFNHQVLDSHLDIPMERVQPWFTALDLLHQYFHQESTRWRLTTGQVVLFDNRRVLHGRDGYRATTERHLRGCYFHRDYAESKLRSLQANQLTNG